MSGSSSSTPGLTVRKPALTLASFTKPWFGGSHGANLTPNLDLARKHVNKAFQKGMLEIQAVGTRFLKIEAPFPSLTEPSNHVSSVPSFHQPIGRTLVFGADDSNFDANRFVRSPSADTQSPWPRYGVTEALEIRNSKLSITSSNLDDKTFEYHRKMASKDKKHRSMGDEEWMSHLRRFAAVGVWPSDAGNRPAPCQKKWHDLYLKDGPWCLEQMTATLTVSHPFKECSYLIQIIFQIPHLSSGSHVFSALTKNVSFNWLVPLKPQLER
ncbi:hypothetical protein F2P81_024443 [Scophthalmus maximus]|uniref:Uncharacterized protein n=1 Tax=Scophthalmus maximus TaxID=52904 RepID=A0A6A4RPH8_SCOMX|nr:hypothetical protein F2P81_024443 [Scophthalmus maximus]